MQNLSAAQHNQLLLRVTDYQVEDTILRTVKSISVLLFIVLGVLLNSILVLAICKGSKFHRPTFYFLLNLSVSDLVRSALCLPFFLITLIHSNVSTGSQVCKSASFFYSLLAYETVFTLLSLCVCRYFIIAHNNFYRNKLTKFVCITLIAMTWTLAVIMAIPPIFRVSIPPSNRTESGVPPLPDANVMPAQTRMAVESVGPVCCLGDQYCSTKEGLQTLGPQLQLFIVIISVLLILVHLGYLRIFLFMRGHRKMNPMRRIPAISNNWTFFGPGAVPVMPSSVSAHFQSAIVQGAPGLVGARPQLTDSREAIDNYHMEEKVTKTIYFLTATITFLWCPYIVTTYMSLASKEPTSEYILFFATFLTFFQSAVTPLACILMMPPIVDMACDVLRTINCKRKKRRSRPQGMGIYENLTDVNNCTSV